jgi:hypothetical protein
MVEIRVESGVTARDQNQIKIIIWVIEHISSIERVHDKVFFKAKSSEHLNILLSFTCFENGMWSTAVFATRFGRAAVFERTAGSERSARFEDVSREFLISLESFRRHFGRRKPQKTEGQKDKNELHVS